MSDSGMEKVCRDVEAGTFAYKSKKMPEGSAEFKKMRADRALASGGDFGATRAHGFDARELVERNPAEFTLKELMTIYARLHPEGADVGSYEQLLNMAAVDRAVAPAVRVFWAQYKMEDGYFNVREACREFKDALARDDAKLPYTLKESTRRNLAHLVERDFKQEIFLAERANTLLGVFEEEVMGVIRRYKLPVSPELVGERMRKFALTFKKLSGEFSHAGGLYYSSSHSAQVRSEFLSQGGGHVLKEVVTHESYHAISGQAFSIDETGTKGATSQRVGVDQRNRFAWLNEALTQDLTIKHTEYLRETGSLERASAQRIANSASYKDEIKLLNLIVEKLSKREGVDIEDSKRQFYAAYFEGIESADGDKRMLAWRELSRRIRLHFGDGFLVHLDEIIGPMSFKDGSFTPEYKKGISSAITYVKNEMWIKDTGSEWKNARDRHHPARAAEIVRLKAAAKDADDASGRVVVVPAANPFLKNGAERGSADEATGPVTLLETVQRFGQALRSFVARKK